MNKQEAIEKLKKKRLFFEDDYVGVITVIDLGYAQKIISQIDEPQKVVVPKFVAEWIEEARAEEYSLYGAWEMVKEGSEIFWWLFDGHENNQDTFNRAWLDGYEVEQEKLYTVEIPNPNMIEEEHSVLVKNAFNQIVMVRVYGDNWRTVNKGSHLTESEIKQEFEWAWDAGFAKEVE